MIDVLNRKIDHAKALDFGTIINECIELFKKVWAQGLVMMLLTMLLMLPFYIIMYIPLIAMGILESQQDYGQEPSIFFMIILGLLMLFMMLAAIIITTGIKAAFYRICKQRDLEIGGSEDYFYFLRKPYFGKTVAIGLATMGIALLAYAACVVPIIYAIIPISFINVVYAFNPDLTVSDIIRTSFKLGTKKWLLSFGLIIVAGIMAQVVGMLMCFIGIFVTASFAALPLYFVYKHVIGFEHRDQIEDPERLLEL